MKSGMKKGLAIGTIAGMLIGSSLSVVASDQIKLIVNGREIQTDVPPQLVNGRTMVPIRFVAEALGAQVKWDGVNNAVVITSNGRAGSAGSLSKDTNTYLSDMSPYYVSIYAGYVSNGDIGTFKGDYNTYEDCHRLKKSIANKAFTNGVSIVTYYGGLAQVNYNLNSKYSKLSFQLGLDDSKSAQSTQVTINGDNKQLWVGTLSASGSVQDVSIDVTGVTTLEIGVQGTDSSNSTAVDLANPILK